MHSKQSTYDVWAPFLSPHRPPAQQPGRLDQNGHAFIAWTSSTDRSTGNIVAAGGATGAVGWTTSDAVGVRSLVAREASQMFRIWIGSWGVSAAQRQYAVSCRQTAGHGQWSQLMR